MNCQTLCFMMLFGYNLRCKNTLATTVQIWHDVVTHKSQQNCFVTDFMKLILLDVIYKRKKKEKEYIDMINIMKPKKI